MHSSVVSGCDPRFGRLLRDWRRLRGHSQLSLSTEAGISTRHLSFLETGRSMPSREMVLRLSNALDVPLRERNALLEAAGFASIYRETDLAAPELGSLRRMIDFLLERQEPFPAVLLDRAWNLLGTNATAPRLFAGFVTHPGPPWNDEPPNLLRMTLHPDALQPYIVNFDEVASELLTGLHRKVASSLEDRELQALLAELRSLPGIPGSARVPDLARAPLPVLPLHLKKNDLELRLFSAVTSIASAQDVTVAELRIESLMPADGPTEAAIRRLAASS